MYAMSLHISATYQRVVSIMLPSGLKCRFSNCKWASPAFQLHEITFVGTQDCDRRGRVGDPLRGSIIRGRRRLEGSSHSCETEKSKGTHNERTTPEEQRVTIVRRRRCVRWSDQRESYSIMYRPSAHGNANAGTLACR